MYWDFQCSPDELSGQWQAFMQLVVYVSAGICILMVTFGWVIKAPIFYKLMAFIFFAGMAYMSNKEIIDSNMQCFGTPYFGG